MHPDIALFGYAGSGKDTVAHHLVSPYSYQRVAFADPLKDMAFTVDPIIEEHSDRVWRLSEVVQSYGRDLVKRQFPEVRRFLQHLGQAQREVDEDYWLNLALRKIDATDMDTPIVVTDVRYPNEYNELKSRGFLMVRIDRPGVGPANGHPSEHVGQFWPDVVLHNNSTLHALNTLVDTLLNT